MDLIIRPGIVDDYRDAQFERKPHGIIFVDGKEVAHTLQCPHCGGHFTSIKGSGHRRHWCLKCAAVTCGSQACVPCRSFLHEIERLTRNE